MREGRMQKNQSENGGSWTLRCFGLNANVGKGSDSMRRKRANNL
jgi:hypothetical protein